MTSLKETAVSFQTLSKAEESVKYKGKVWTIIKNKPAKMQLLEKVALKAAKEFSYCYQACLGLTIWDVLNRKGKIVIFSK